MADGPTLWPNNNNNNNNNNTQTISLRAVTQQISHYKGAHQRGG